jgi:hypothetical protein
VLAAFATSAASSCWRAFGWCRTTASVYLLPLFATAALVFGTINGLDRRAPAGGATRY